RRPPRSRPGARSRSHSSTSPSGREALSAKALAELSLPGRAAPLERHEPAHVAPPAGADVDEPEDRSRSPAEPAVAVPADAVGSRRVARAAPVGIDEVEAPPGLRPRPPSRPRLAEIRR